MSVLVELEVPAEQAAQEGAAFQKLVSFSSDLTLERSADAPPEPGQKGASIALGTFVMGLVTSGAVTALIQVLQHYLGRNRTASVSFTDANGSSMTVSAENLAPAELEETTRRLKAVFDGS